jgi:hypothetical protein
MSRPLCLSAFYISRLVDLSCTIPIPRVTTRQISTTEIWKSFFISFSVSSQLLWTISFSVSSQLLWTTRSDKLRTNNKDCTKWYCQVRYSAIVQSDWISVRVKMQAYYIHFHYKIWLYCLHYSKKYEETVKVLVLPSSKSMKRSHIHRYDRINQTDKKE